MKSEKMMPCGMDAMPTASALDSSAGVHRNTKMYSALSYSAIIAMMDLSPAAAPPPAPVPVRHTTT